MFNKTIAGRRRTLLLNVKPARMSVKSFLHSHTSAAFECLSLRVVASACMGVFVCVCVCLCALLYVRVCGHLGVHVWVCRFTGTYICVPGYMCMRTRTRVCICTK